MGNENLLTMKKVLLVVCAVVCSVFYVAAQEGEFSRQIGSFSDDKPTTDWRVRYKGEVNVGYSITGNNFSWDGKYFDSEGNREYKKGCLKTNTVFSRPLFETIHGIQIGPYFFVGAGVGLQYYCGKTNEANDHFAMTEDIYNSAYRWNAIMLPIFGNIKFLYPVNSDFSPYIDFGIGTTLGCYSSFDTTMAYDNVSMGGGVDGSGYVAVKTRGGLYCDCGVGFRYRALNVGLGFQHQVFKINITTEESSGYYYYDFRASFLTRINSLYLKVGVNF